MNKICAISTVEITMINFIIPSMRIMKEQGYDITLICNMSNDFYEKYSKEFHCINIKMKRGVSLTDLIKLPFIFKKIFQENKFDYVQYATPNASLYASIGAKLAKVPARVYCQWGIRYVGSKGIMRKILKLLEKITCYNSTHIRPASWKNLDFAVNEHLYKKEKATVIGDGGTIGIDLNQFDITSKKIMKEEVLQQYPQLNDKQIFAFVGRLNRDKGVFELFEAFLKLSSSTSNIALLLIGDMEGDLPPHLKGIRNNPNIILTGWTNKVATYLAASDILVHPSYREGFSMVIQQAMAMELPVITTDIPGPSEVIKAGETGVLVQPRDSESLYKAMKWMIENPNERNTMGKAGRVRCEKLFTRKRMLQLTLEDRIKILNNK